MAYAPEGSELIYNAVSKAPGFRKENVFILAGVPNIMRSMLDIIIPTLSKGKPLKSIEIKAEVPEGSIAEELRAIQNKFKSVDIGSYPYYTEGNIGTNLVLVSIDEKMLEIVKIEVEELIKRFT